MMRPHAAVLRWWRSVRPDGRSTKADMLAGLPGAIASVPSGMASGVLAGVNPVQGLYASFAGPAAGGLATSTRLMVVTTTSAAALAAGSSLDDVNPADRPEAMSLLTLIAGLVMVAAGIFKLGRYTRFVSHSVMSGFLTGVAVNIVCSQLPDLAGAPAEGSIPLTKALSVVLHPSRIDVASLLVGLGALALLLLMAARPRLAVVGALAAMIVPTVVALVALDSVATVEDVAAVPTGLPLPELPELGQWTPGLLYGAVAVAAIVLVQGAGVSEAVPNPGGGRADADADFVGQGIGNVAAGMVKGMPVGGSVSQTALNVSVGAKSRWAAIWTGVWMAIILVLFSGVVGQVAMPTLAAVLIAAAIGSLRLGELVTILRTGQIPQVALISTLLATVFLSVPAAVGIGVSLSLLLQLNREALDLRVVRLMPDDDGGWIEAEAPSQLPDREVVVLDVYGSLFYAGARTLQARLPEVGDASSPVVVLRLRGRTSLGSTSFVVFGTYARQLAAVGGRLYLSGVDEALVQRMRESGALTLDGPVSVFAATPRLGASTAAAHDAAQGWLVRGRTTRDG